MRSRDLEEHLLPYDRPLLLSRRLVAFSIGCRRHAALRSRRCIAEANGRQWLAFLNGAGHGATHEIEKALAIGRVRDPLSRKFLRRSNTQECRFEFGMRAHGGANVHLLISQL